MKTKPKNKTLSYEMWGAPPTDWVNPQYILVTRKTKISRQWMAAHGYQKVVVTYEN